MHNPRRVMNDGMPGLNMRCYTEATGHPANRNCSSGSTKQQRAPFNCGTPSRRSGLATSTAIPCSLGERETILQSCVFQNGVAPFALLIPKSERLLPHCFYSVSILLLNYAKVPVRHEARLVVRASTSRTFLGLGVFTETGLLLCGGNLLLKAL